MNYPKEKKSKFLHFYLKFSLILSIIGLFITIKGFFQVPKESIVAFFIGLVVLLFTIAFIIYIIISIYAIVYFYKNQLNKLNYIIPIVAILGAVFDILLIVYFYQVSMSVAIPTANVGYILTIVDVGVNIFTIIFSVFLLKKFFK